MNLVEFRSTAVVVCFCCCQRYATSLLLDVCQSPASTPVSLAQTCWLSAKHCQVSASRQRQPSTACPLWWKFRWYSAEGQVLDEQVELIHIHVPFTVQGHPRSKIMASESPTLYFITIFNRLIKNKLTNGFCIIL